MTTRELKNMSRERLEMARNSLGHVWRADSKHFQKMSLFDAMMYVGTARGLALAIDDPSQRSGMVREVESFLPHLQKACEAV